jgi:hypothetical protein
MEASSCPAIDCEKLGAGRCGYWTGTGSEPPAMTMITFSLPNSVLLIFPKLPVFGGWHVDGTFVSSFVSSLFLRIPQCYLHCAIAASKTLAGINTGFRNS